MGSTNEFNSYTWNGAAIPTTYFAFFSHQKNVSSIKAGNFSWKTERSKVLGQEIQKVCVVIAE